MKILFKILTIVFLCIFIILIIEGIYSVYREIKLFKQKINRNALVIGYSIKNMVRYIWEIGGQRQDSQSSDGEGADPLRD